MGAKSKEYRAGNFLFNEGDVSDCMYLIQKGTVSIRKKKGSGYIEIARVYHNEVIGELSFFDRSARNAAAVALSEVTALEIDFESVDKLYKGIPPYFQTIMACVADRLKKADERIQRLQRHLVDDDFTPSAEKTGFDDPESVLAMAEQIETPKGSGPTEDDED